MQSYVQLTLNEYDELKTKQVEATTLVEQTNKNLSRKLTEANEKITELESDLRKYVISGARIRDKVPIEEVVEIPTVRSKWSAEDDYIIVDSDGDLVSTLALKLNRSEASIRSRASYLGYKIKHKKVIKNSRI